MPEVNEAVIATYLAASNTRRLRGALQPLLKAAPLSKSAVSRVIASLPSENAALLLLFSLVASGQIRLRRIDGWRKIAAMLSLHTPVAA